LALIEYLYGVHLRANAILFPASSGAMAPTEAVDLVLAGAGLLLIDTETRHGRRPTELFGLVLAGVSLTTLVAFLYGTLPRPDTGISGLSTIAFTILALGLLFARPRRGLV